MFIFRILYAVVFCVPYASGIFFFLHWLAENNRVFLSEIDGGSLLNVKFQFVASLVVTSIMAEVLAWLNARIMECDHDYQLQQKVDRGIVN